MHRTGEAWIAWRRELPLLALGALALGVITTYATVQQVGGHAFLDTEQIQRHYTVVQFEGFFSLDSWAYRLLSAFGVEWLIQLYQALDKEDPWRDAFIHVRFVQNTAIFVLLHLLYRRLGLRPVAAFLGLCLLAWGMTQASIGSDLKFDTYSDIIFYLVAAHLVLSGPDRWIWIVPLVALAATNRETSGAIPLLLLGLVLVWGLRSGRARWAIAVGVTGLVAFLLSWGAVRGIVGDRPLFIPNGRPPGWSLFDYNMDVRSWFQVFLTLNLLPLICWLGFRRWPLELRAWSLAIVPLWMVIHVFTAVIWESRVFLVPMALIFVPGALMAAGQGIAFPRSALRTAPVERLRNLLPFALGGAVALAVSLFAGDFYEVTRPDGTVETVTAWEYLARVDLVILAAAIVAGVAAAVPRFDLRARAAVVLGAGAVATGLVYRQLTATPGIDQTVQSRGAGYVALIGAAIVLLIGVMEILRRVVKPRLLPDEHDPPASAPRAPASEPAFSAA